MPTFPQPLPQPPVLPGLLAHQLRWAIVRYLADGDLRVGELATATAQGANLVSYHLGKLRAAGLVTVRRSAADARDNYYALDLDTVGRGITELAGALHPALPAGPPVHAAGRVLFICTANSARSPMAAAWLRHLGGPRVIARSAGITAGAVHPLAVAAMAERGIDIAGHRTTPVSAMAHRRFIRVITVCDLAREACPDLPLARAKVHWSVPNPSDAHPADLDAFRTAARELETRVRYLLPTLAP